MGQQFDTHTHTQKQSKAKSLAAAKWWDARALLRYYEPVLTNPSRGGLVPHRRGCSMSRVMVLAPEVKLGVLDHIHPLMDIDSNLTFASPDIKYPLMLQLHGWAVPQFTSSPHLYSWVDCSNVSKVSCSRKQQQHQSVLSENQTCNLSISRPMP